MKVQGREDGEWGLRKLTDGWHVIEFGEGIDVLKKQDGTIVVDKNGNACYKFPAKVNDDTDECNGFDSSLLIYANNGGEYKVADIIACADERENFEQNFPGDRSFFEEEIINKIKIKVPGKFARIKKETTMGKDADGNPKEYSNFVKILHMKLKPEEEAPETAPKAGKSTKKEW